MVKRYVALAVVVCVAVLQLWPWPSAWAAGATLIFGPGTLTTTPGGQTSTTVLVSSDQSVNSVDFTVTFPAALVSVVKVDTSATDFPSMFMGPPTVNNSAGTVHFLQSKVGGTTSGNVGTITFQAKSTGSGSLGIAGGKVIANNGQGTNVYSGTNGATITVQAQAANATPTPVKTQSTFKPTATSAPTISSTTHPDQQKWYKSREVAISWTGGSSAYNFAFDQSPTTQLPDKSAGSQTSATTTLAADGLWFAHVKALSSSGWSATSHFALQADTKLPAEFTPTAEPAGHGSVMPKVSFASHDETSGIDHYELRVDGGDWATATSPYTVAKLAVGRHTIQVKAVDKAGNSTVGEVVYTLDSPDAPIITFPTNNQFFLLGQSVSIKGKADPNVSVDIYLNDKKSGTVKADKDGNFVSKKQFMLFAGAYKLMAKAISSDGIISPPSETIHFNLDAKAIQLLGMAWPGWMVSTLTSMLFGFMAAVIVWLFYRLWRLGRVWARRVAGMKKAVHTDLAKLEEQVDHEVDQLLTENASQATAVKAEVAKAVDVAEQHLNTVSQAMLQPEPWLPILHGRDRFGQTAGKATATVALDLPIDGVSGGVAPIADASVAYGTAVIDSAEPKPAEATKVEAPATKLDSAEPPSAQSASTDPGSTTTTSPAEAVLVPAEVSSLPEASAQPPGGPTDPPTAIPQESATNEPSTDTPQHQATSTEVKVDDLPAPQVDLLAPTITAATARKES